MVLLLACLENNVHGSPGEADSQLWVGDSSGVYLMTSMYALLSQQASTCRPVKLIWHLGMPSKAGFWMWLVCWGRILIVDNLMRRGVAMENRCNFCLSDCKMVRHLFFMVPGFLLPLVLRRIVVQASLGNAGVSKSVVGVIASA